MKLLQGDCMELLPEIPDNTVDMILCDLPYGTTRSPWDHVLPMEKLWKEYRRLLRPNGAAVLFSSQPFTTELISSNRPEFRYCWYWLKNIATGFAFAKYQPMRKVEEICVFYRKHGTYNPQGLQIVNSPKTRQSGKRKPGGVYNFDTLMQEYTPKYKGYPVNVLQFNTERSLHPTQKPVPILEYLVKTYTHEGGTVLDNCMGSGSTGVACVRTGRHFIGMEKDPHYFAIAQARLKKEQTQAAAHVAGRDI